MKIAVSTFSIVCEDKVAEHQLSEIYERVEKTKIDSFLQQTGSNVVAPNKLDSKFTIKANLGLLVHVTGHPKTIAHRLRGYEAVRIDLVVLKFESIIEDTLQFHHQVISKYFHSGAPRSILSSV